MLLILGGERDNIAASLGDVRDDIYCCYWVVRGIMLVIMGGERDNTAAVGWRGG
jgi:hypothetical protein